MNKHSKILFTIGILVYVVFFFVFFPQYMVFSDENEYLRAAYQLGKGNIIVEDTFDSYRYYNIDGNFIPKYPIANSALLLPFTSIHWRLGFLLGFIMHILSFVLFVKILDHYKIHKLYGLLLLLYPGLIFYSRTLMSELPTLFFTVFGFYCFLSSSRTRSFLAGVAWGIAALIRPSNALVIVAFLLPTVWRSIHSWCETKTFLNRDMKKLAFIVIGVIPPMIFALGYNFFIYGGILSSSYSRGSAAVYTETLTISLNSFQYYWKPLVLLLLVYPFLLIAPFVAKYKHKAEIVLTLLLFFFILGKENVVRYDWVTNLVIGHRYFFPIIPLLLVPYAQILKKVSRSLIIIFVIILFLATPGIIYTQHQYTSSNAHVMQQIYDTIPEGSLIVAKDWPDIYFLNNYFGEEYSVVDWKVFNTIEYDGEYFFLHYKNLALRGQVRKESDIGLILKHDRQFFEISESQNMTKFYENNGLFIHRRAAINTTG